jgi:hypothetical protein
MGSVGRRRGDVSAGEVTSEEQHSRGTFSPESEKDRCGVWSAGCGIQRFGTSVHRLYRPRGLGCSDLRLLERSGRRTHGRRCVMARLPVNGVDAEYVEACRMETIRATSLQGRMIFGSSHVRFLGSSPFVVLPRPGRLEAGVTWLLPSWCRRPARPPSPNPSPLPRTSSRSRRGIAPRRPCA